MGEHIYSLSVVFSSARQVSEVPFPHQVCLIVYPSYSSWDGMRQTRILDGFRSRPDESRTMPAAQEDQEVLCWEGDSARAVLGTPVASKCSLKTPKGKLGCPALLSKAAQNHTLFYALNSRSCHLTLPEMLMEMLLICHKHSSCFP